MYATCCRLRGASLCSEVVDAFEHLLVPEPLCKPFPPPPPVKVKLCDGVCLGDRGVSGMLSHCGGSVKSHEW